MFTSEESIPIHAGCHWIVMCTLGNNMAVVRHTYIHICMYLAILLTQIKHGFTRFDLNTLV